MKHAELILILDFGSQYTQLIARRIREIHVYCEIHPYSLSVNAVRAMNPSGIILSGGPSSVYDSSAPISDKEILTLGIPILGICYGLQLIAFQLGGEVDKAARREFGRSLLYTDDQADLFKNIPGKTFVWMSHGDALTKMPVGFQALAHSENAPICAVRSGSKKIFGVQFHPEVVHTDEGKQIIANFCLDICGCRGDWTAASFIGQSIDKIRETVGGRGVLCALSGGVDSSVAALLLHRSIGEKLFCIHIDNGLMRRGESAAVVETFRDHFHIALDFVDASTLFLDRLAGVTDPEEKRKIIGSTFIDVFDAEAAKRADAEFLAQGTLYPDIIESVSVKGPSAAIKSHHNVGGLPERMKLRLIEPFRELFKDEVREVGKQLGLPASLSGRHPFPGPGLAIRIIGEITAERLEILRTVDDIFLEELRLSDQYDKIWQAFAVLLPVRSVGVMGDERTYENTIALRAVTSVDGMTADWAHIPYGILSTISNRIINEVRGVNRVVYDISSKPPATIEWE